MAKVNINDVLQGLIQPIGSLKGGSTYPVTAADQIWVYTDHNTHRPLDEYLSAMKTEAAETTQTFVSNATALTEGKIAKTSIVGGRAAKCKVGDIVLVADGNIYKISAIDEINITLALPALASYATAASLPRNRVLHGDLKDATGAPSYPGGGGGGKQVPPTLNLLNLSNDSDLVRTSITEEEKTNIEKGLYNSVLYADLSLGELARYSVYFPEYATIFDGSFIFSIYIPSADEDDETLSITGTRLYTLDLGEKNADGTYPISIEKLADVPFGGSGSSNLPVLDLSAYEDKVLTDEEITAIENTTGTLVNIKLPGLFGSIIPKTLNIGIVEKKDGVDASNTSIILLSSPFINILNELLYSIAIFKVMYIINDNKELELKFLDLSAPLSGENVLTWDDKDNRRRWRSGLDAIPCNEGDNNKFLSVRNGHPYWADAMFNHFITLTSPTLGTVSFNCYSMNRGAFTMEWLKIQLSDKSISCSGYINNNGSRKIARCISGNGSKVLNVEWFDLSDGSIGSTVIDDTFTITDKFLLFGY